MVHRGIQTDQISKGKKKTDQGVMEEDQSKVFTGDQGTDCLQTIF